jgi:hypothetical membrane protein
MFANLSSTQPVSKTMKDCVTVAALGLGITVPFIYYGTQIVAAPYFADYSFARQPASLLGSDRSTHPAIFNTGVMATGTATLVAALGFFIALRRIGANLFLSGLTSVALLGTAISSLWAGYYPMPDPRHSGHPAFLIAMLALPFLFLVTFWKVRNARLLKAYMIATIALLVAMVPIMSGNTSLDNRAYGGLFQRIFAFTVFPPIAVCAYYLARRIQTDETPKLGSVSPLPEH